MPGNNSIDLENNSFLRSQFSKITNEIQAFKSQNQSQLDLLGKLVWKKEITITEKDKPLQTLLKKHLSFFGEFIEITAGKQVQLRITSTSNLILLEIFSYNGATESLIDSKYYEFIKDSLDPNVNPENVSFNSSINPIQRQLYIGEINYQKGMFQAEKQRREEIQGYNISLTELAKTLANKLPEYSQPNIVNSFNGNQDANFSLGDNNTQSVKIQNQSEFLNKLLDIAVILEESLKSGLNVKEKHFTFELEKDIQELKSKPIIKTEAKSWIEKVEKYISVGGSLISLSEKISPIIQELLKFIK
jgi:hypothetical protein